MPSTVAADFAFEPKVWSDHIKAYFDRILVFGAFALRNDELKAESTGLTINFPYFKALGDAEEPAENDVLSVDRLQDDSFFATVFEVAKAVGFKKKVFKKSAASSDSIMQEAMRQLGRVHAEKVDKKLLAEADSTGNYTQGYQATLAGDIMNVRSLLRSKIVAFGDKHKQAVVCFMHSLQFLDLMTDTTAGFLKADALDPMYMVEGFEGRLLGMAIVTVDSMTKNPAGQVGGKDVYRSLLFKENAYGLMTKQDMEMDNDKDILAREIIVSSNEWYAVKSFHAKVSADDKKAAATTTTIS